MARLVHPAFSRRSALLGGAGAALGLAGVGALARPAYASPDDRDLASPFGAHYLAAGTVFTRDATALPLAANSGAVARHVTQMPAHYVSASYKRWLRTWLNTTHFTTPIYLVDSTVPGHDRATVTVAPMPETEAYETLCGEVPLPSWAEPGEGTDRSLAVYDVGAGVLREYFGIECTGPRRWEAVRGGVHRAAPGLRDLATDNYAMRLDAGANAVVGMLTPLAQIGIDEVRGGEIGHAVGVTFANASEHGVSWPARRTDGADPSPDAPQLGQWFRLPPGLDLDSLGLRPLTLLIARAVQRHGGFGIGTNQWCHAFHCEHPVNEIHRTGRNPWAPHGELHNRLGSLEVNDFPWHLTEWAAIEASEESTPDRPAPAKPSRGWLDWLR